VAYGSEGMSDLISDAVLIVELWLKESLYDDRRGTGKGLMSFPDDAMTGVRRKPVGPVILV
jgi:hypothetical protein